MDPIEPVVTIVETEPSAPRSSRRGRTVAAVGATTLATLVIAAGIAAAGPNHFAGSSTSGSYGAGSYGYGTEATPSAGTHGDHGKGRGPGAAGGFAGGNAIHGEATVKKADGTYEVVDTQKGAVTAVSASAITLKSDDGYTATYVVDSATKVRGTTNKAIGDVTVGETVQVVATKTGSTLTATSVGVPGTHPEHKDGAKPTASASASAGA